MPEEIKLPTTVEEFQRERRKAALQGVLEANQHRTFSGRQMDEEQARQMVREIYPIRTTTTRVLTDSANVEWKWEDGTLWLKPESNSPWERASRYPRYITPDRIRVWKDLMDHPTEQVEE